MRNNLLFKALSVLQQRVIWLTTILLIFVQISVNAQNITVNGQVKDPKGSTLPGVNVVLKGSSAGSVTDNNGKFSIVAPSDGIIVFSYVGFQSLELPINGRAILDVTLIESTEDLAEVVVLGYGTQKKRDVTGSVAVVTSKDLKDRPNTQFGYSLEGKVTGIQVVRSSGQPQAGFSIKVRGTSSITSGSAPLYIVDGVQTYNTNEINPSDIESFTILKDAGSAAIYGSSGANGVVLITTKRGTNQKLKLDFNTSLTLSQAWKRMSVLNGSQFQDLATEMGATTDWNKYNANTNWQDEIFRNALSQNYQLSATGGNKKTSYYVSGSLIDQNGIVLNNSVKRGTLKTNFDHQLTSFLKVGTSLSFDNWKDVDVSEGNRNGVITRLLTSLPNIGIWDKDNPNTYARSPFINDLENPVSTVNEPVHSYKNNRFHGNLYGEAQIIDGLKIKSLFGFENSAGEYNSYQDSVKTRWGISNKGLATYNYYNYQYWVSENTVSYDKTIQDNSISIMTGMIISREKTDNMYQSSHDFSLAAPGDHSVAAGAVQSQPIPDFAQKSHVAYIGRLNYSYKEKYFITSNFRADGSGQFSSKNRWGYFPSFSAGWRLSQEDFFKGSSLISEMKLRAGWGLVGNDRAKPYAWYGLVDTLSNKYLIGGITHTGYTPSTLENTALRWEKTSQVDIGVDVGFLANRISLTADYYYKKTTDLLLEVPQPTSTGFSSALQNAGSLENKGFEFQISSRNIINSDFKWSTDFNISFNKNKVLDIVGNVIHSGGINPAGSTYNTALVKEGEPLGSFYGKISEGVDPATGMIKFMQTKAGGADSVGIIGNANPKFIYGLTNSFSYKGFTLDIFIQGVYGNKILNATRILSESMALPMNQAATVLNRWKNPGDITDMPKVTPDDWSNSLPSTRYLENGSYLRVKSVTLGYTFKTSTLSRLKIRSCMIYLTAENLLTFTKYTGFDPEVSAFSGNGQDVTNQNTAAGVDFGMYPQSRDFIFGLKLSF